MERSGLRFEHFCLEVVKNRETKKMFFFGWICLTKQGGNHASLWIRDLWSKSISLILAYKNPSFEIHWISKHVGIDAISVLHVSLPLQLFWNFFAFSNWKNLFHPCMQFLENKEMSCVTRYKSNSDFNLLGVSVSEAPFSFVIVFKSWFLLFPW